jgi:hypothetical protein
MKRFLIAVGLILLVCCFSGCDGIPNPGLASERIGGTISNDYPKLTLSHSGDIFSYQIENGSDLKVAIVVGTGKLQTFASLDDAIASLPTPYRDLNPAKPKASLSIQSINQKFEWIAVIAEATGVDGKVHYLQDWMKIRSEVTSR